LAGKLSQQTGSLHTLFFTPAHTTTRDALPGLDCSLLYIQTTRLQAKI